MHTAPLPVPDDQSTIARDLAWIEYDQDGTPLFIWIDDRELDAAEAAVYYEDLITAQGMSIQHDECEVIEWSKREGRFVSLRNYLIV